MVTLRVNIKNVANLLHETATDHAVGPKENLVRFQGGRHGYIFHGTRKKERTALKQVDTNTL
ncbi:MAG: hypothetical protein FJ115_02925, partial [Deltaproteobacteria bacterium]|nr:hypothetical protein [Deltaproteobacteria bacterium]